MDEINGQFPAKQEFCELLDATFRMRLTDGSGFDLSLVNFDDHVSNSAQENFSLLFRAPGAAPPFQGIYRLENDRLGEMDLFLVPVKKDGDGLYYEAVFNNLVGQ